MEPRTFTVASERLNGHRAGDVVDGNDLGGDIDVDALVAAGHLELKTGGKSKPEKAEKPEGSE